jgi:hypothetical protein
MRRALKTFGASMLAATIAFGFLQIFPSNLFSRMCPDQSIDCRYEDQNCKSDGHGGSPACKCKYIAGMLSCEINNDPQ